MTTPNQSYVAVTIADSASLSSSTGDTAGMVPCGVVLGSSVEGTQLTFQVSYDGTNFNNVYYDNAGTATELNHVKTDSAYNAFSANVITALMGGVAYKIRTGTNGSPTTQTGAQNIQVVCRFI